MSHTQKHTVQHVHTSTSTSCVPIHRVRGPHESRGTHNAGISTWGTVLNLRYVITPPHSPTSHPPHNCSLSWACTPAWPHSPTNWYPLKAAAGKASLQISNSTGEPEGNKTNDPHGSIHKQKLEKMRHYKSLSLFVTQSFSSVISIILLVCWLSKTCFWFNNCHLNAIIGNNLKEKKQFYFIFLSTEVVIIVIIIIITIMFTTLPISLV